MTFQGPCKNCKDRVPGCHGSCETYINVRNEWEELRKQIYEAKKQDRLWKDYTTRWK